MGLPSISPTGERAAISLQTPSRVKAGGESTTAEARVPSEHPQGVEPGPQ